MDEELHERTVFERVSAEVRPAKTKSKIRNKLKWKEDNELNEKTDESKHPTTNSDKSTILHRKKEPGEAKSFENKKSERTANSTGETEQSIPWIIARGIIDEILIWVIIIMILVIMRIESLKFSFLNRWKK